MDFFYFVNGFLLVSVQMGVTLFSPLRINGSALESIFSVLKHTSGGNLSAIAYSPALGKFINRKDLVVNQHSEKDYRDQILNIDGQSIITTDNQISVKCSNVCRSLCQFSFPATIAQSSLGGRQGSNACTIIAVRFGHYALMHTLLNSACLHYMHESCMQACMLHAYHMHAVHARGMQANWHICMHFHACMKSACMPQA